MVFTIFALLSTLQLSYPHVIILVTDNCLLKALASMPTYHLKTNFTIHLSSLSVYSRRHYDKEFCIARQCDSRCRCTIYKVPTLTSRIMLPNATTRMLRRTHHTTIMTAACCHQLFHPPLISFADTHLRTASFTSYSALKLFLSLYLRLHLRTFLDKRR